MEKCEYCGQMTNSGWRGYFRLQDVPENDFRNVFISYGTCVSSCERFYKLIFFIDKKVIPLQSNLK